MEKRNETGKREAQHSKEAQRSKETQRSMEIICPVCMHHCRLQPGQAGRCRARANADGESRSLSYARLTSLALDPIEKKPLAMYEPGSLILSAGSFGCNLNCPFCQNYEISMCNETCDTVYLTPEELAGKAAELKKKGNIGVAFTYNEPMIGYEYVRDTARLVRGEGMKNVVVTNGSVTQAILEEVLPFVDAMNIDLKGFSEEYYRKLGGDLETVKQFIRRAAASCYVELTVLVVPGENDTPEEMKKLASWTAEVDREIPLHVTRFFPRWKMTDRPPTKVRTVYELAEAAREILPHVFTGNC